MCAFSTKWPLNQLLMECGQLVAGIRYICKALIRVWVKSYKVASFFSASRTRDVTLSTWHTFLDVSFPDPFLSAVDPTRICSYSESINWNALQDGINLLSSYFSDCRSSTQAK